MMNKNLLYFLLLLILALAVYFLVLKKPWATLNADETSFAVEDTFSVAKIFIADMEGNTVTLKRNESGWTVNDRYRVRGDYVEILLTTIKNIGIYFPVADAAKENVLKDLSSRNIKVEIYNREDQKLNSYFIGSGAINSSGNYVLREGAKNPYVAGLPGFQGVIDSRFVTRMEEIRDRSIFSYSTSEIKSVKVNYAGRPDSSFSIQRFSADSFLIVNGIALAIPFASVDKEKATSYLKLFSFINAEAFANSLELKRDSILSTQESFCTITLSNRNNETKAVKCFYMPINRTSEKYDALGNIVPYDRDRYFALINDDKDFVIIQQFHFGRLFRIFSDFIKSSSD